MADLVSSDNTQGRITNSDLELVALMLQDATFPVLALTRLGGLHSPVSTIHALLLGRSGKLPP